MTESPKPQSNGPSSGPSTGNRGPSTGGSSRGPPGKRKKGKFGKSGPRRRSMNQDDTPWIPKTKIGKDVLDGKITDISEILRSGTPLMEIQIVNKLLPNLNEEVIDVRRVQRTLDSGRRMRFSVMAAVGDKNGHVGLGIAKGVEAGPTIRKAIDRAKLNIIEIRRGCGSWECGCGEPHTVPFKVSGKQSSVKITLSPAPKGLGLVAGDNSKKVLDFAGIKDVWVHSSGQTRTIINQVSAVFDALKELNKFKANESEAKKLGIKSGSV